MERCNDTPIQYSEEKIRYPLLQTNPKRNLSSMDSHKLKL